MDDLIEQALEAVGIPLTMRERAKENLKRKSKEEIEAIIKKANKRKERVKTMIENGFFG